MPVYSYDDMRPYILEDLGLPDDTWFCDGVRACDNPYRRASLTKHGLMKQSTHKASVVADWTKAEVMDGLPAGASACRQTTSCSRAASTR